MAKESKREAKGAEKGESKGESEPKKIKAQQNKIKIEGAKRDGAKGDGAKGDGVKGDGAKGDGAKGDGAKGDGERQRRSTLLSRNIRIDRHRTSVRLEPIFWDILQHITQREKLSVHVVCTKVAERAPLLPLTGALRIFLIAYAWRAGMSSALEAVRTGKMEL